MDIAKQIIDSMPNNLTDLEKARYLYLELCKIVVFSTQLLNTDNQTFSILFRKKVDVHHLDDIQVNCRMWSQLYHQLLDLVGITNEIINNGHQYVVLHINDKKWIADATRGTYTDLSRVKNNDETIGFGLCLYQNTDNYDNQAVVIDEETRNIINKMDQKLGYSIDSKRNLSELKNHLIQIREGNILFTDVIQNSEITEENVVPFKLEYLYSKLGKLGIGYYEQKDFVYHLEKLLLNDREMSTVGATELKKTNADKTVDIVQCIYAYSGDNIHYYLLAPNMTVNPYEKEQIIKLAILGYGIEKDEKPIPGIIYPKKFEVGTISSNFQYKMHKFMVGMKLIPADPIFDYLEETNRIK